MRRSALIGPWGVGAIVPFPDNESLMIAGLDAWRFGNNKEDFVIHDKRLEKRLGVSEFRWPPDYREYSADPQNAKLKIPTVRFPTWLYCPYCGTMEKVKFTSRSAAPECRCYPWKDGRKCDPNIKRNRLIPERFIVICPEGHIDDFPVAQWLHQDPDHPYDPTKCVIRRSTGGASSALSGVRYQCTCGAERSIAGATREGALAKIGYKCRGTKPWFDMEKDDERPCASPNEVKVVLSGGTNVWFGDTRSSIHIPVPSDKYVGRIKQELDHVLPKIDSYRVDGEINFELLKMYADVRDLDPDEFVKAVNECIEDANRDSVEETYENMPEDEYRLAEYAVLVQDSGGDLQDFHCVNHAIQEYDQSLQEIFKSISLVHKLRETRALVGFSRMIPRNLSPSEGKKMLRRGRANWLPAIEVFGEGIFFEFNKELLQTWAQKSTVKNRVEKLEESLKGSFLGRDFNGNLKPEYVLIHTFAHLLINQLSFTCGYGSSSIRERIYCTKDDKDQSMFGVLIYTASGDSEGSMGGLVRQGLPGNIENIILDALDNATWCSSDPVCIQSMGQGPESCNLAACYNCSILPETCCETGNRLLDRGLLVGTLEDKDLGFFKDLLALET